MRSSLNSNPMPRTMGRLRLIHPVTARLIVRPAAISSALLSSPRAEAFPGAVYLIIDAADLRGPSNHGAAKLSKLSLELL